MGLVVLGLQQAGVVGLDRRRGRSGCIVVGAAAARRVRRRRAARRPTPLIELRIFAQRAFAVDNVVLLLMSAVFVPFFFFASVYAQASLGDSATQAGLFLLVFFGGFATAAQWGGRIVDKRGARPAVVLGCAARRGRLLPVGHDSSPTLDFGDAVVLRSRSRAPGSGSCSGRSAPTRSTARRTPSYGEVTGITQTVRNLGASLGLAIMGSLFVQPERRPRSRRP